MTIIARRAGLTTDPSVGRYNDIRDLLPGVDNPSPLVRLNHVPPADRLERYLKLERLNPFGSVKDRAAAYRTTKEIWRREALMVGPSTGAAVHAATLVDAEPGDVAVVFSADSGVKYTSYFEEILGDEGRPRI